MEAEERIRIAKELDVDAMIRHAEEQGDVLSEDEALAILHKSRYFLARKGYLRDDYAIASRQWLIKNNIDLPEIPTEEKQVH